MVARILLRGEPARIEKFRARLLALLEQFKAETSGPQPEKTDAYALTLGFYPLPRPVDGSVPRQPDDCPSGATDEGRRRSATRRVSPRGNESASS